MIVREEPFDATGLDLHGMTAIVAVPSSGPPFARFYRDGRHHDTPLWWAMKQEGVDSVRNTFDCIKQGKT